MKNYLIDLMNYNNWANCKLLETMLVMPDKEESVMFFSHLITAQEKWLNRITKENDDKLFTWFSPVFPANELLDRWTESFQKILTFIESKNEEEFEEKVMLIRPTDGKLMSAKLRDIILQFNYHSIHHRAQINRIIRQQGLKPPATDYIINKIEEVI